MLNLVDGQWITSRVRDAVAGWTETHKIVYMGNSDIFIAAERVLVMTVDDVFPVDLQPEPASLTHVVITLFSQGNHFRISRLEFSGSVLLDTFLGLMAVELAAFFLAPELPTRLLCLMVRLIRSFYAICLLQKRANVLPFFSRLCSALSNNKLIQRRTATCQIIT